MSGLNKMIQATTDEHVGREQEYSRDAASSLMVRLPGRVRIPTSLIDWAKPMTFPGQAQTRTWVVGGVVLLFAAVVAVILRREGDPLRARERGSGRPPFAGLSSHDDTDVLRNRARHAIGAGRFDLAFETLRTIEERRWDAEVCRALASALLERGRIVLGWAALEAAWRIDPKHKEAASVLTEMRLEPARAKGEQRTRLREAFHLVEALRAVPRGPPLGLLVVGLASFARDSDQEQEFLDRIAVRERAAIHGVDSSLAATKLIARLLLETGRALEAHDLLVSVVSNSRAHGDRAAGNGTHDREAAWLLGRAALQLDRHELADAMLGLAGDFGKRASPSPEPAPFVGSKRCGECHRRIYREQQRQSRHAQTLRFASGLKGVPLPAHPVPDPVIEGLTHSFSRKADDRIELESRAGDQVNHAIVAYAVGSGRHGITMLAKDQHGIDRELRVSYFAEAERWGETKGIEFAPRDPEDRIGVALAPRSLHKCLHCHTTWFASVENRGRGQRRPEAADHGIGCERCHGPGSNHIKAALSGYAEPAIALGPTTPSLERLKSCALCHAADGSAQSNDPEFTRAQGTTFLFSRCFTASKDRFGCTTCHDPHRKVDTSTAHYEAKCLECHRAVSPGLAAGASAEVDREKPRPSAPACPVNDVANCISCHMPKVEAPSRRSRFTDHHIRVHRPAAVGARLPPGR
jgi:hypothetical protein